MGKLGYQAITLTDLTETLPISLILQSNYSQNIQVKKDGNYVPNFETGEELIITPLLQQGSKKLNVPVGDGTGTNPFIWYQVGETDSNGEINYYYGSGNNTEFIYVDEKGCLHYKKNLSENLNIEAYIDEYQSKEFGVEYERISANVLNILFMDEGSNQYTFTIDSIKDYFSEEQRENIILTASLWKNNELVSSGFSYSWKKLSDSSYSASGKQISVSRAEINASEMYTCVATKDDLQFIANKIIRDFTDNYHGQIIANDNLILTPEKTTLELTHQIWHANEEINKLNGERFTYQWSVLHPAENTSGNFNNATEKVLSININDENFKNLPKKDFTIACESSIKEENIVKTKVLSFIDIKYSPISYQVNLTPKTIFVPVKSDGSPMNDGFSQTVKFQLLNSETKEILTYLPENSSQPSLLETINGTALNFTQTENKWEFIGDFTINFGKDPSDFWTNTESHSKTYRISYKYLNQTFTEEFEVVKIFSGSDGEDGISISNIQEYYARSTSNSIEPTSWTTTVPTLTSTYKYLWNYEVITFTNGTFQESDKRVLGAYGDSGKDGITYYTWVKYADSPTTGMSDNPEGKKYIGLAYNKISSSESTNYNDYSWSLIKGEDGSDGINGIDGKDGKNYYTWIKYADDIYGRNMTNDPAGKFYIGIAYNKETSIESSVASDYAWSLFRGSDGINGENGQDGVGIKTITNYYLASSLPSGVTVSTSGWTPTIQSVSSSKKYLWNYEEIVFTDNTSISTTPCIIGNYASDGAQGPSGYVVDLSNSFHTFSGGEAMAELGQKEAFCEVSAYQGTTECQITEIKIKTDTAATYQSLYSSSASNFEINISNINLFAKANKDGNKIKITFMAGKTGYFLSEIEPILLQITVYDGLKSLTFIKTFNYTINYNSKTYYLDFIGNDGTSCNTIFYSDIEGTYNPSSFTVKAYSRNSATGAASEYTNGKIVYSFDGKTWTLLNNNQIKDYFNLNKIYIRLYSAAATSLNISNLDNFKEYLLDQEEIPILADMLGMEFGGENLIKWSKTLPIESYKWSKTSGDANLTISQDGDFAVMNLYSNDGTKTWRSFCSPKINLLSEYIGKSFVFSCMVKVNSDVTLDGVSFVVGGYIDSGISTARNCYKIFGTLNQTNVGSMNTKETWATNKWIKIYKIFELEELDSTDNNTLVPTPLENCRYFNILFYLNNNGNVQIKQPKLELGNVPSAWSASPYDIDFSNVSGTNLLSYGSSYRIDVYSGENNGYVDIPIGNFDAIGDYTFSWKDVVNNYKNSSLTNFYIELYQTEDGEVKTLKYSNSYPLGEPNSFTKTIDFSEGLLRIHAKSSSTAVLNENEHLIFYCLKAERGNIATPYVLDSSQIANIVNIIENQNQTIGEQQIKIETIEGITYVTPSELEVYVKEQTGGYVTTDSLRGEIEAVTNDFITGNPSDDKYNSVAGYFQQIQRSVKIVTSAEQDPNAPYIQIGTNIGDQTAPEVMNFYTRITDNRLSFYENNQEIAYLSGESLMINKAQFLNSFIIGNSNSGELKVSITETGIGFLWED